MKRTLLFFLGNLFTLSYSLLLSEEVPPVPDHVTFQQETSKEGMRYLISVPKTYDKKKGARLFLWLHGAGHSAKHNAPAFMEKSALDQDIIVLADAGKDRAWGRDKKDAAHVGALIHSLKKKYSITKTYLAGFSRGGFFCYTVALQHHPELIDGILSFGGGLSLRNVPKTEVCLRIPIYIYHGSKDPIIRPETARRAYKKLQEAGYRVKLEMDEGVAHMFMAKLLKPALEWIESEERPLHNDDRIQSDPDPTSGVEASPLVLSISEG